MRVAFLTYARLPDLYEDDHLAVTALRERGVLVEPVQWDTATPISLSAFDAVVMRSPWDWYHRRAEFRRFLGQLAHVTCPVLNSPAVLLEFADKRYLARLERAGVAVVPTVVLDSVEEVPAVLAARGWEEAVLKPAFTANAFDAHRFTRDRVAEVCASAARLPDGEQWLLQPFMRGVLEGELSFVFFGGVFSHAVKKVPRGGDWRVQHDHGGVAAPFHASEAQVAQAEVMLRAAAPDTLYARVDCVLVGETLHLMELEAVEPELFFRFEAGAAARFAEALCRVAAEAHRGSAAAR